MEREIKQVKIELDDQNRILKQCDSCHRWLPAFPHVFPVTNDQQLDRMCWQCWDEAAQHSVSHREPESITMS